MDLVYLQDENYEDAFTEALSAMSGVVMIWMLNQLDPSAVLGTLTQVLLISLVQQLGHDMSSEVVMIAPPEFSLLHRNYDKFTTALCARI